VRQFAAETAFLHAAEGHAWVAGGVAVDEHAAGFQFAGQLLGQLHVGGVDRRGQAEIAVVGQGHGVGAIAGGDDRRHRAEQFLFERGHAVGDIGQHSRLIVVARTFGLAAAEQQRGAFFEGGAHLLVEFVAQVETCHRADVGVGGQRIADLQLARGFDEFTGEFLDHAFFDDQALGRGAHLAGVLVTANHGSLHGFVEIGVVEHDERIRTAQFQHAFLQCGTGLGTDGHAGAYAAGQGDGGDTRVCNRSGYAFRGDVDHFKHAVGETGIFERVTQQVGAAHHVRRMLEHVGVAGDQRRYRAAQHLPDREVPRHHREDRAERTVLDPRFAAFNLGRLGVEHGRSVFGVPLAELGAFFDFATGLGNRLAHFQGDHGRHGFSAVTQGTGQCGQGAGAVLQRLAFPLRETECGAGQRSVEGVGGFKRVVADLLAGGGVDRDGVGLAGNRAHGGLLRVQWMGLE